MPGDELLNSWFQRSESNSSGAGPEQPRSHSIGASRIPNPTIHPTWAPNFGTVTEKWKSPKISGKSRLVKHSSIWPEWIQWMTIFPILNGFLHMFFKNCEGGWWDPPTSEYFANVRSFKQCQCFAPMGCKESLKYTHRFHPLKGQVLDLG